MKFREKLRLPGRLRTQQILCVAAGLAMGICASIAQQRDRQVADGELERPGIGQEAQTQQILVDGLDEADGCLVEVSLSPRRYSPKEAAEACDRAVSELPGRILGDNQSLDEVRQNLNLVTNMEEYGLRLRWESDAPELIDSYGEIHSLKLPEQGRETVLTVEMTDGWYTQTYSLKVCVLPPLTSPGEDALHAFLEMVAEEDRRQQNSPYLVLPSDYRGRELSYRLPEESPFAGLAALGVAAALLLAVRERSGAQQAKKKREAQLMIDYPEIVSKLMIFLGAGMTIRTAWDRICGDYMQMVQKGKQKPRFAYEEMYEASYEMKRGVPEGQAYSAFGRRCGLQPYIKLCSLLEQNRKNGSRNLRDLLKLEMTDAFEQRKHGARRLGEEASTRLLFPLFLMLGVVMVMIAVPAFMEFL